MTTLQINTVTSLLKEHLGSSIRHKNNEHSYHCPFCNHHKKKLQVNVESQKWHCWVCNSKGQTIKSLLRKSKAPAHISNKMQEIYGDVAIHTTSKSVTSVCTLPDGYKPLYAQSKSPHHKNALHYAIKRGLTPIDIVKHQVGYCEKGPYSGMLIVPSYDENGLLNYYTGRSFYENATYKHKNPSASKDIIGFEGFVNWTEPIVIVEGAFDAIATKRNAIPLFGKKILPKLRSQILTKKVPRVYLALDPDAYKDSIEEIEYFINNNIPVYYVNLGSKDPSETGYQGMLEAIERSKEVSFFDLMQYKLGL